MALLSTVSDAIISLLSVCLSKWRGFCLSQPQKTCFYNCWWCSPRKGRAEREQIEIILSPRAHKKGCQALKRMVWTHIIGQTTNCGMLSHWVMVTPTVRTAAALSSLSKECALNETWRIQLQCVWAGSAPRQMICWPPVKNISALQKEINYLRSKSVR